jgi:uncharacterized caspase-like protein
MTRKALLIGINDYAPAGFGGPDLRGCVNDVRDMANTLSVMGLVPATPGSMRILTDARAVRAAIIDGIKWLVARAVSGDVLIFYYSGHGSQVADLNGDELDGKDETICPHDFATAGMMTDDDIRTLIAGLPVGVKMDVILDSCHSGNATRELSSSFADPQAVSCRYIEPPVDYGFFLDAEPALHVRGLFRRPDGMGEKESLAITGLNHVLWAGCRDNQTSAEAAIGGVYRGVFTYNFCKALRGAGVAITRRRLEAQVAVNIRGMGYGQVPQLEGAAAALAQRVFS